MQNGTQDLRIQGVEIYNLDDLCFCADPRFHLLKSRLLQMGILSKHNNPFH